MRPFLPLCCALLVLLASCALLPGARPERAAEATGDAAPGGSAPRGIHRAAAEGDLAALQAALAQRPALLDARDRGGWTPAAHAAWAGQKAAYDYLLQRGAATTVYTEAAFGPLPALAERLRAAPAAASSRDPAQQATPLHWAVRAGNEVACELLLARGAPVDAPDRQGRTPLHYACLAGDASGAELLLRSGADPGAADGEGRRPLHLAVEAGDFPMTLLLVESGAPLDAPDRRGDTALHLASARGGFELCEYLLAVGAAPAVRNAAGRTPLDLARQAGHARVASLLEMQVAR